MDSSETPLESQNMENQNQSRIRTSLGNIRIGGVNFQRRTAEGSRLLRENLHTVMEEIRPLVEQARTVNQGGISLSSFLRPQSSQRSTENSENESFVINLENQNGRNLNIRNSTSGNTFGNPNGNTFGNLNGNGYHGNVFGQTGSNGQNGANGSGFQGNSIGIGDGTFGNGSHGNGNGFHGNGNSFHGNGTNGNGSHSNESFGNGSHGNGTNGNGFHGNGSGSHGNAPPFGTQNVPQNNENFLNSVREAHINLEQNQMAPNNPENIETSAVDALRQVPEARALLDVLQKYVPFLFLLVFKALYDHREGIFNFIILFSCFCHANSVVKSEAAKQNRRSLSTLFIEIFYIFGCIVLITFMFIEENMFSNLIFIPPYTKPLSVWDLLWTVGITDFFLKLFTVFIKICVVALPNKVIAYQKRGKIYLLIEATSQLYRSLAPIQPWLYYLLESYVGIEKIAGVFLSAAYMVSKGSDLLTRGRMFKTAFIKAFQNVSVGVSPTKEQLATMGSGQCPICHDDFDCPVLLQCRHIFCEVCVTTWFDREQTCPLCRAKVVDDPSWRDGSTTFFIQLF